MQAAANVAIKPSADAGTTRAAGEGAPRVRRSTGQDLHRTLGNRAVQHLLRASTLQAKLTVSTPDDVYEQEADRMADEVMRMPEPAATAVGATPSAPRIQRLCPECEEKVQRQMPPEEEEPLVQTKRERADLEQGAADIEPYVGSLAGRGAPLTPPTRAFFEPRFGAGFSAVRLHTDAAASRSAESINALAYTVGNHIVFRADRYDLSSQEGRHLLAHELTHVLQQGGPDREPQQLTHIGNGDGEPVRKEAAKRVVPIQAMQGSLSLSAATVRRQPTPPAPALTRAKEIRLSFTSPGEIAVTLNPPTLTLYNFAIDRSTLKKKHVAALQAIAFLTNQFAGTVKIQASGHADSSGEDTVNLPLSRDRAVGVQTALQGATGLPVFVAWFSDYLPAATNDTVEGRSRNRRVDISFSVKGGPQPPEPCQGPQLLLCACQRSPELCQFCLDHPALCFCALFFEACLFCIASLTNLAKCYCKLFPCKRERPCVVSVNFPPTAPSIQAQKIPSSPFGAWLAANFNMGIIFKDDDTGCSCRLGEYKQEIRGFAERDYATGTMRRADPPGLTLSLADYQEDLREGGWHYGIRSEQIGNQDPDEFLPDRETGCEYKGYDTPGLTNGAPGEHLHFKFEFRGCPVDRRNRSVPLAGWQWRYWTVEGDWIVPKGPPSPLINRPFIVRSGLPKDPKVGQEVTLEIAFPGQPPGCYGKIPVSIIVVDDISVTILTRNLAAVQIAPDACPDVWVLPHQAVTIAR